MSIADTIGRHEDRCLSSETYGMRTVVSVTISEHCSNQRSKEPDESMSGQTFSSMTAVGSLPRFDKGQRGVEANSVNLIA
jgi:hypothetical protein